MLNACNEEAIGGDEEENTTEDISNINVNTHYIVALVKRKNIVIESSKIKKKDKVDTLDAISHVESRTITEKGEERIIEVDEEKGNTINSNKEVNVR